MKNLDGAKFKEPNYLEEYINQETYKPVECSVTSVIRNLLEQIYKLNMENINLLRNNNSKIKYDKNLKGNQFDNCIRIYEKFENISLVENQAFRILNELEKSVIEIYIKDPRNCKICILNITLLVLEFQKKQLDLIAEAEVDPSSDVDFSAKPDNSRLDDSVETERSSSTNPPSKSNSGGNPKSSAPKSGGDADPKPKPPKDNKKETKLNVDSVDYLNDSNEGSLRLEQIVFRSIVLFLLIVIFGFELYVSNDLKSIVRKNSDNITYQIGQIYTPPIDKFKDYGYLKTQFDKLIKPEVPLLKITDSSLPQTSDPIPLVATESKKGNISFDEIAPNLKTNLDYLDKKIEALNKINEKIEIKLDGEVLKKIFDSVVKDENSDFGKMIKKINGIGEKKSENTVDTVSAKDKKELASLKGENNKLKESVVNREKEISKEKDSVGKLTNDITLKANKILELEAKIKSIGDEKTGFKGLTGSFAILFTNSKDFPLNKSILSTAFTLIEKQPKDQNIGVYIATGNQIAANLDIRDKKEKSLNLISPTGSPTEMLGDAGQAFLDYAFDGKNPIPIPDRKAIIIATWSAEAPKFNSSGWKDISQVDAILIQPANVQQIRYAKSWLDFVNQKNGRLLLISGPDNFDAGSDNLKQLSKQISTLLNTKKD